jgi:hypothetical protein
MGTTLIGVWLVCGAFAISPLQPWGVKDWICSCCGKALFDFGLCAWAVKVISIVE